MKHVCLPQQHEASSTEPDTWYPCTSGTLALPVSLQSAQLGDQLLMRCLFFLLVFAAAPSE
jgi:hypothetical protein